MADPTNAEKIQGLNKKAATAAMRRQENMEFERDITITDAIRAVIPEADDTYRELQLLGDQDKAYDVARAAIKGRGAARVRHATGNKSAAPANEEEALLEGTMAYGGTGVDELAVNFAKHGARMPSLLGAERNATDRTAEGLFKAAGSSLEGKIRPLLDDKAKKDLGLSEDTTARQVARGQMDRAYALVQQSGQREPKSLYARLNEE